MSGMPKSKIPWCERSWSPVTGCTPCSEGCLKCYAQSMLKRFPRMGGPGVMLHPERLDQPARTKRPSLVFVCPMADLFHEAVPDYFIGAALSFVDTALQHTFLILTKRPERMCRVLGQATPPAANLALGVSVENQKCADARIPLLLATPAAMRFVSIEPMLGPVDISPWLWVEDSRDYGQGCREYGLDFVILGGENGPGARPMNLHWARSVRDQCKASGVPFFFKGWGDAEERRQLTDAQPVPAMPREFPAWCADLAKNCKLT